MAFPPRSLQSRLLLLSDDQRGVSLVELSMVIGLVVILASSAVDIGRALRTRQTLTDAARNGVRSVARFAATQGAVGAINGCESVEEPSPVADPLGAHCDRQYVGTNESYEICEYQSAALSTCDLLATAVPANYGQAVKRTICQALTAAGLGREANSWTITPALWRGKLEGKNWRYMKVTITGQLDCALCIAALGDVRVTSSYTIPTPPGNLARCTNL